MVSMQTMRQTDGMCLKKRAPKQVVQIMLYSLSSAYRIIAGILITNALGKPKDPLRFVAEFSTTAGRI